MPIKILIADDHELFRQGMKALLEARKNIEVIGSASDGDEAVNMSRKLKPDVVVMDVDMPKLNGIEATRRIIHNTPSVKVLALSMHVQEPFVTEMIKAGASGYLFKDCAVGELEQAIEFALNNRRYFSPQVSDALADRLFFGEGKEGSLIGSLTTREREVLQQIAEGKSTKEIAGNMHVSVKTVETYRRRIKEKLNIDSVAGLVKLAVKEGLASL